MLILTRNPQQSIIIGDDITITILGRTGNQIQLGITAPDDVTIHRQEVYDRIQAEKEKDNPGDFNN